MICYPCTTNNHDDCRGPDCDCDCQSLSPHGTEKQQQDMLKAMAFAFGKIIGERK